MYDEETELYYLQSRYYNPEMGRFINADGFTSTGQGVLGNHAFAYCGNNPVCNKDITGTRYCAATTVSGENSYDRYISCSWQNTVALVKTNPAPIGKTDKGNVYFVKDENSIKATFPGDVVIVDKRIPQGKDSSPDVQIRNSALIRDRDTQMQILTLLCQYEKNNSSPWVRDININSMLVEWDAHNDIYDVWANERCLHVDLDNRDLNTTYLGYWRRAVYETLGL